MAEESHADRHDHNKLDRWWLDMSSEVEPHDALHAIFLVTEKHTHAHHIFRRFRQAYDDIGAPFHSLVIFGQHGSSLAGRVLAQHIGIPDESIPALVLFQSHHANNATIVPLGPDQADPQRYLEDFLADGCSWRSLQKVLPLLSPLAPQGPNTSTIASLIQQSMDQVAVTAPQEA